jgi:hypothetical protein
MMKGPGGSPANAWLDCANPNGSAPVTSSYGVTITTFTSSAKDRTIEKGKRMRCGSTAGAKWH